MLNRFDELFAALLRLAPGGLGASLPHPSPTAARLRSDDGQHSAGSRTPRGHTCPVRPYARHDYDGRSSRGVFSGELNEIASLISTIYLSAYAMLNLCTFHVAYYKPLGWRPSYKVCMTSGASVARAKRVTTTVFQFYNKWLSLVGAVICTSVMVFIDMKMSATVACAIIVLYTIAARKHDGML